MSEPIIITRTGAVRGRTEAGVSRFFGIPYAAPPVGALRFQPPQPHAPWAETRDAAGRGPTPPQFTRPFSGLDIVPLIGEGWSPGDDYLSLNIWAPEGDATGRPVLVFIHGGAFTLGSKDASVHDGSAFARSGIVCVAINYRLGIEGFLPIPGGATNLGLRDQLFALRWVQENIAGFGGDPANVTVAGESAGAMSIATLIPSPLARGLFRRAIVQSGHGAMTRSLPVAERLTYKLARMLGVEPTLAGFAATTPAQGLEAIKTISLPTARIDLREADGRDPTFGLSRFAPVHGDDVVPIDPLEALKQGAGAEIELLIGSNSDEMNLYFVPTGVQAALKTPLAWLALRKRQPQAWQVLKAYGIRTRAAGIAFTKALTDLVFRWPSRRFAEEFQGRAHVYDFSWPSPQFGGGLGACHGMELPFVFDTLAVTTGAEGLAGPNPPQELATRIHALWVDFIRDGALPWAPFDRETRRVFDPATLAEVSEPPMPCAPHLP